MRANAFCCHGNRDDCGLILVVCVCVIIVTAQFFAADLFQSTIGKSPQHFLGGGVLVSMEELGLAERVESPM
jgi:hypothetical protein